MEREIRPAKVILAALTTQRRNIPTYIHFAHTERRHAYVLSDHTLISLALARARARAQIIPRSCLWKASAWPFWSVVGFLLAAVRFCLRSQQLHAGCAPVHDPQRSATVPSRNRLHFS